MRLSNLWVLLLAAAACGGRVDSVAVGAPPTDAGTDCHVTWSYTWPISCTGGHCALADGGAIVSGDPATVGGATDGGGTVGAVTCEADFGGGLGQTYDVACGDGESLYSVTWASDACDAAHFPHACPVGTPCVVHGPDVDLSGTCQ